MPGMHSMDNPGTAAGSDLLYCVVRAPGTNRLDFTSFDGFEWSTPRQEIVNNATTGVGLASARFGGSARLATARGFMPTIYALRDNGDTPSSAVIPTMTLETPAIAYAIFDETYGVFRAPGATS
ncbi:hypothetical protein [Streptomyces griseoluteus]